MNVRLKVGLISVVSSLSLISCGGGSNTNSSSLSGTAAVGAPLAGAVIEVIDANGTIRTTTTAADGSYTISTQGLVAPLIVRATGDLGDSVVRLSSAIASLENTGTLNITPLTDAAVASIASDYDANTVQPNQVTGAALNSAMEQILGATANVSRAVGYKGTNPFQDSFSANSTGLDALLDAIGVEPTVAGINFINRGKAISDSESPERVVLLKSGSNVTVAGQLSTPDALLETRLLTLERKLETCFALPAVNRVSVLWTDSDGAATPDADSLNAACSSFVSTSYLHNGKSFAFRWVDDLTDAGTEPTVSYTPDFLVRSLYAIPTANANVFQYVVDITWKDKNGVGYSKPEVLRLNNNDELELYGNRRSYSAFVQPLISVLKAQKSTYGPGNSNDRTEGRLRFLVQPHLIDGEYKYTSTPSEGVAPDQLSPLPTLGCVWVTGDYITGITNHNPTAPKGGLLLKTPHSNVTGSQSYMAISRQYVASFDPLNDQTHLNQLLNDCKAYADGRSGFGDAPAQSSNRNAYTTHRTNPNYTIDLHIPSGSEFTFDGADADQNALHFTTFGHGPVFAPSMLSPNHGGSLASQQAAEVAVLPRHTFYFIGRSIPTTVDGTNTPVSSFNDQTAPYLLDVLTTRMLRALPVLTEVSKIVTPTLSDMSISNYLRENESGAGQLSAITISWDNDFNGEVWTQRVGVSSFYRRDVSRIFDPSRSGESFKVRKTESSGEFTLDKDLPAFSAVNGQYGNPPSNIHSVYREVWLRGVDKRGRQIQPVYSFEKLR